MSTLVYFCPDCGKTVARSGANRDLCSACHGKMIQTDIEAERWKQLTDSEKKHVKSIWQEFGSPQFSGEEVARVAERYMLSGIQKIKVTTCDLKRDYEILGPVFYQINDAGSGLNFTRKAIEYRDKIIQLKHNGQILEERTSFTETMAGIVGLFDIFNYGDVLPSTKDYMGQNHKNFEAAFFIAVEELKKKAFLLGADAVIGMRHDFDLDTNGFQHFYLQIYGTAVKFVQ